MKRQISVSVPATSANLGPGFDCLGLALELRNLVTVVEIEKGCEIYVEGEGSSTIPRDRSNLVARSMERLFQLVDRRPEGLQINLENQIPVSSGLGSSAAAVLGGILAADALVEANLTKNELLSLASEMEGHSDNVVPALYGGLTLVVQNEGRVVIEKLPVASFRAGLILPRFDLPTNRARAVLPKLVPLQDAIFNTGRIGLLIQALATGDFHRLVIAMQDRLHQPYRLPLVPGMEEAFNEAHRQGAAVALSGAGPSILLFAPEALEEILATVNEVFLSFGISSRSWILPISEQGCLVSGHEV